MTRKDYEAFAAIIKNAPIARGYYAEEMAKVFKRDNPRFDANKFFAAADLADYMFADMDGTIKRI